MLKDKIYSLKQRYQRFRRGYADVDCWSIDYWMLSTLPKLLRQQIDQGMGWPGPYQYKEIKSAEDWDAIRERMIFLLNEANEDTCSQKNKYEDEAISKYSIEDNKFVCSASPEVREAYLHREEEIYYYRNKCKDEALDMLKKYFWSLWD